MKDLFSLGVCRLQKKSPAFLLGLEFLLGLSFAATYQYLLLLLAILFLYPLFKSDKGQGFARAPLYLLICALGLLYGHFFFKLPEVSLPNKGSILFSPSSVKLQRSLFHTSYVYKGEIEYFAGEDGAELYHLPCTLYAPKGLERPLADSSFFLKGTLEKISCKEAEFTPTGPWQKVKGSFSFAEMRFKAKKAFQAFIHQKVSHKKAAAFFYALSTGDVEDRMMSYEFSKVGLQHILAISGFHFALIALFMGYFLKKLFSEKVSLALLLLLLSCYFFFLGSSPSVFRAWIAITIWSLSKLFQRKSSGLNTLGICLLIELVFDPRSIFHLGFQLSFLCTAALLLCTPITLKWMEKIFPKRSKEELEPFSHIEKVAYLGCSFFRSTLAVNLAVHIASIPVCLYHFQSFPFLSLAYNLFFPLLTGICLFTFMMALLLFFLLPPLGQLLFTISSSAASFLLGTSSSPPALLEYSLRSSSISFIFVVFYLTGILLVFSACLYQKEEVQKNI